MFARRPSCHLIFDSSLGRCADAPGTFALDHAENAVVKRVPFLVLSEEDVRQKQAEVRTRIIFPAQHLSFALSSHIPHQQGTFLVFLPVCGAALLQAVLTAYAPMDCLLVAICDCRRTLPPLRR